jgi:hypothetical protein
MLYGIDYLGGAKYQRLILDEHPSGWAAGFFVQPELFGDPAPVIRTLAGSGRCPLIRINLAWSDEHIFNESDFPGIVVRAQRYTKMANRYPNVRWYFSGATEHQLNAQLAKKLANQVLSVMPANAIYVNNPWGGRGELITGNRIINEVHGTKEHAPKGPFFFSYDGSSCVDDDVELRKRKMKDAEVFFFWHPACNGRLTTQDKTKRPDRQAYPTNELLDSMIYLHNSPGVGINIPDGWIWKSHADRHKTPPEPREYKPVLLSPIQANRFELVAENGQVVAASAPAEPFKDGGWRYYFPDFGYNLAEKARRIQKGNPVCSLRANGKIHGKVNPAFRAGTFRD